MKSVQLNKPLIYNGMNIGLVKILDLQLVDDQVLGQNLYRGI